MADVGEPASVHEVHFGPRRRVVVRSIQEGRIIMRDLDQLGEDRLEVRDIPVAEGIDIRGARGAPFLRPERGN